MQHKWVALLYRWVEKSEGGAETAWQAILALAPEPRQQSVAVLGR